MIVINEIALIVFIGVNVLQETYKLHEIILLNSLPEICIALDRV